MQKLLCSFAVVLLLSACAMPTSAQMMIGGRVGLDMGNLSFDPAAPSGTTVSSHTGILVGAQLDNWFNDMWALSVQLLYDQKGMHEDYSYNFGGLSASGSLDEVMSYLEIPILAKVAFSAGDIRPYIFAGPSIGVLLSASASSGTTTANDTSFNKLDLAALVGAGVSYKVGGMSLFLDAGYAIGLMNIANSNATNSNGATQTAKTNDIRIAAGVMFPLN